MNNCLQNHKVWMSALLTIIKRILTCIHEGTTILDPYALSISPRERVGGYSDIDKLIVHSYILQILQIRFCSYGDPLTRNAPRNQKNNSSCAQVRDIDIKLSVGSSFFFDARHHGKIILSENINIRNKRIRSAHAYNTQSSIVKGTECLPYKFVTRCNIHDNRIYTSYCKSRNLLYIRNISSSL